MERNNEIIIQGKKALAEANRTFFAQYDTDDKQIDYYTELAIALYDEFEIDGEMTYNGVRKNVATWFESKKPQMDLFRKHPYWCEEAKAIVFSQTEVRGVDYKLAFCELERLEYWVYDKLCHNGLDTNKWYLYAIKYALHRLVDDNCTQNGLITQEFIDAFRCELGSLEIPNTVERSLRVGTKITRFVNKCWQNVPMKDGTMFDATTLTDDGDPRTCKSFNKYYAKFADCLSELKIKKITLVSLNFLDFMTMSNGNSWSSCHFINSHGIFHEDSESSYEGQYKAGCLSYALDKPSFLLYTLPANFTGTDYYRCQKLTRMCCQYEGGILVTGKCYPNNADSLITRYRQMMQMILSEVEEMPNLWTFSKKTHKINAFVETSDNTAHYADYHMEHQKPTISFCKGASVDLDATLMVGHEAYCLYCGETLYGSDHKWLQCGAHRTIKRCQCCNKYLKSTDIYHKIGKKYYCEEHVFYCDYHQRYEPTSSKWGKTTICGEEMTICYDTMDEFRPCGVCGMLHHPDDLTDGLCSYCASTYVKCKFCGKYVTKDEVTTKNGKSFCTNCMGFKLNIDFDAPCNVGDLVLMQKDLSCCTHGCNGSMQRNYSNRIVRIREQWGSGIYVTNLDGSDWTWSRNCIAGVIKHGIDALIGMTLEEANNYLKEMNENDEA